MAVKITDRETESGKKFRKMLEELKKLEVRIGIHQGAVSRDGADLVDRAMWNELGTEHIPARPFLRQSVDAHKDKIEKFLKAMAKRLVNRGSAEEVLKNIGEFQVKLVRKEITTGYFTPNSPATIKYKHDKKVGKKKKSSKKKKNTDKKTDSEQKIGTIKPLIDDGDMKKAINYMIREKGGGN